MIVSLFEYRVLKILSLNVNMTPKQLKVKYKELHDVVPFLFYSRLMIMDFKNLLLIGTSHINITIDGKDRKDHFEYFFENDKEYIKNSKPWLFFS